MHRRRVRGLRRHAATHDSELDVYSLYPTEEIVGAADDREYVCLAITADGSPLTASVEGSGRVTLVIVLAPKGV